MHSSHRALSPTWFFHHLSRVALPLLFGVNAHAHMPYLLPNVSEESTRDHVSVIASFTEQLFVPDVAMKSDHFAVITPSGIRQPITQVVYLKDMAVFEMDTPEQGVYRVTSGERLGRKSQMWQKPDGQWESIGRDAKLPDNAKPVDVQSVTVAEAYVLRGKTTQHTTALTPIGQGIEIKLSTHPRDIVAGKPLQAELLLNGKPLANTGIEFFRGSLDGLNEPRTRSVTTDAQGKFSFTPEQAGTYLALARHRTQAPAGAETPWRSYSYTLTFAVLN